MWDSLRNIEPVTIKIEKFLVSFYSTLHRREFCNGCYRTYSNPSQKAHTKSAGKLKQREILLRASSKTLRQTIRGLKKRICDESGNIRRFVNIYLNDEDIRFLDGNATAVKDGDEISIIPAIAGGLSDDERD